jgi:hypothetical protein
MCLTKIESIKYFHLSKFNFSERKLARFNNKHSVESESSCFSFSLLSIYNLCFQRASSEVVAVSVLPECEQSWPCHHLCDVMFANGTVERRYISGLDAISDRYWSFLSLKWKEHFNGMKHYLAKYSDLSESYNQFLRHVSEAMSDD